MLSYHHNFLCNIYIFIIYCTICYNCLYFIYVYIFPITIIVLCNIIILLLLFTITLYNTKDYRYLVLYKSINIKYFFLSACMPYNCAVYRSCKPTYAIL